MMLQTDFIVILHTSEYRGDHSAEITQCFSFADLHLVLESLKIDDWVEIKRIATIKKVEP